MNQYYDYKKFIGFGIIHESDENNYICIGSFKEGKKAYFILFLNDGKSRRDYVIQRVFNIVNSIDLKRQAKVI